MKNAWNFIMDNEDYNIIGESVVMIDGKKYYKIWYSDENAMYHFVYDHAPETAVVDDYE